jgi:hypothetical protein
MSPPVNSHYLLIPDIGSGSLRNYKFNSPKALVPMRQQLVELFAGVFDLARLIGRGNSHGHEVRISARPEECLSLRFKKPINHYCVSLVSGAARNSRRFAISHRGPLSTAAEVLPSGKITLLP